jgi:hypothetical protein
MQTFDGNKRNHLVSSRQTSGPDAMTSLLQLFKIPKNQPRQSLAEGIEGTPKMENQQDKKEVAKQKEQPKTPPHRMIPKQTSPPSIPREIINPKEDEKTPYQRREEKFFEERRGGGG